MYVGSKLGKKWIYLFMILINKKYVFLAIKKGNII